MFQCYIVLIFIIILPFAKSCPSLEKLYPCYCKEDSNVLITCPGLENDQALVDIVYALKYMKKFYSFTIEKGNFMFIPHDVFKEIRFQELEIMSSTFMALTDTDVAFEGLEEDLTSLVITDSYFLNEWDWSVLRQLKKLVKLHVDVELDIINKDIEKLSALNMKDLSFANNKITYVHGKAFSAFKQLLSVSLKNNLISEIKRSMLPNPAVMLRQLDLSNNKIQQLSEDLFENMPALRMLDLGSNKILTLREKALSSVWQQLQQFYAKDNPLMCDCRISWMMEMKFPKDTKASCDQPKQLQGKSLTDLGEKDLWC